MYQPLAQYKFQGQHCYAVAWSPFEVGVLAVVSGANYGLSGGGHVDVLRLESGGVRLVPLWGAPWSDVITDITWSESSPAVLVAGSGDHAVTCFDISKPGAAPLVRREHTQEVSCVTWSQVRSYQALLSTSWDGTAKQWDAGSLLCTQTYPVCAGRVYDAAWCSSEAGQFATASADGVLRVWSGRSTPRPALSVAASPAELLSCDWSRYSGQLIATAGVDGCGRLWDLRSARAPLQQMTGHTYAIRKARFSSFDSDVLATVSYDKTCRLWNTADGRCLVALASHTEFVLGVDWSVLEPRVLATCGWDRSVQVHRAAA